MTRSSVAHRDYLRLPTTRMLPYNNNSLPAGRSQGDSFSGQTQQQQQLLPSLTPLPMLPARYPAEERNPSRTAAATETRPLYQREAYQEEMASGNKVVSFRDERAQEQGVTEEEGGGGTTGNGVRRTASRMMEYMTSPPLYHTGGTYSRERLLSDEMYLSDTFSVFLAECSYKGIRYPVVVFKKDSNFRPKPFFFELSLRNLVPVIEFVRENVHKLPPDFSF